MPVQTQTKVEDVMVKDVVCATVPGSRDDVLKILKNKHISGVPVIKGKTLVGIVTRKDIFRHPEEEQIALLMTRDPITVTPETTIADAARLLLDSNVRRLPVITDHTLVGIVTVADIIRAIANMNIKTPVGDYVKDCLVAVWDEMPLPMVIEVLKLGKASAAPVLNAKTELVGIVSDVDLIAVSEIEDSVEISNMSAGSDDDAWTWESIRDTMNLYYGVSRIKLPDIPVKEVMIKDAITATRHSEVSDCAKKIWKNKIEQIPVITGERKVTGLLRDVDLLKILIE